MLKLKIIPNLEILLVKYDILRIKNQSLINGTKEMQKMTKIEENNHQLADIFLNFT